MKTLKKLLISTVLMSTLGIIAQAPAAPAAGQARSGPRPPTLALTTTAFEDGGIIPNKYTMAATAGAAVSPKLEWTNVPPGTVSFAMILNDQDVPLQKSAAMVLHWMIFNIPGTARELTEGVPAQATLPDGSIQALNIRKGIGYMGMGAGNGPYHHYTFELYALDTKLDLGPDATQKDVEAAMSGHVLGKGALVGRFHMPA
jgi:Raf kinase inhibitor-like YbhB/YbcL family protein